MTDSSSHEPHRLDALDMIRGLAALTVVFWHCFSTLSPKMQLQFTMILNTPLRILIGGKAAVIVFFVLSGFVLALPYFSANPPPYRVFLIKRFCRIYLPFAAAILFAASLYAMTNHGPPGQQWAVEENSIWNSPDPMSLSMIVQHLLMTGTDDGLLLDGPTWSLVHELRISIMFPLLVFLCRHSSLGIVITMLITACTFSVKTWGHFFDFPTDAVDLFSTFLATAYFIPCFLIGILLAKHREEIRTLLIGLNHYLRTGLWAAVFTAFYLYNDFEARIVLTLAAGLLMMLALSSPTVLRVARVPVLRWLGNISYSLYLVHFPILFFLIHVLPPDLSHWWISVLMIALSLATASLMCRFVERSSIKLGKMLARTLESTGLLGQWQWATALAGGLLAILYAQASFQRNPVRQPSPTLWQSLFNSRPDTARVHVYLGEAALAQGGLAEAIAEFQTAIRLNAAYPRPHYGLANAYVAQGRVDEATREFKMALQLQPDFPSVHANLGLLYERQGRVEEAIREERLAIELRPNVPDAHYNLANTYAGVGRTEEAIQEFRTALRLKPDFSDAHNNLGNAYVRQGRLAEGIQEFQTAVRLQPDHSDVHNNLGNAYASQGQSQDAIQEFSAALRLRPDFPEAHYGLGNSYVDQGRLAEAIQEYVTTLRLRPDFLEAHYNLGHAYRLAGLQDEARQQFEIVLRLRPDFPPARQAIEALRP